MTMGLFDPEPQTAELIFAGDAMMHQAQIDAARQRDKTYDYIECFAAVADIVSAADYAVVNLETPLGGAPYSGYPCFCAPDSYAEALKDAGFDLFLTANNHTLDRRDRGLCRTIQVLDTLGVDHIGTYSDRGERSDRIPMVKPINGFDVGFLNYTYGTNGIEPGRGVVVDYIDTLAIRHDIDVTRRAGAELVVVAIHWGDEYHLLPNATQRRLADYLTSHGADMVIGGHPHVIQPMELRVNPADTLDRHLVVYSLGNFISNMKTADTRGGVLLSVTLARDLSGRPYIDHAAYIPVFTVPPTPGHNFRLVNAIESVPPAVAPLRDRFLSGARKIFDTRNVNVPEQ